MRRGTSTHSCSFLSLPPPPLENHGFYDFEGWEQLVCCVCGCFVCVRVCVRLCLYLPVFVCPSLVVRLCLSVSVCICLHLPVSVCLCLSHGEREGVGEEGSARARAKRGAQGRWQRGKGEGASEEGSARARAKRGA